MGHDVEYSATFSDMELMATAKRENRILLTKDLELFQRCISKGVEVFYVEGKDEAARLAELAKRFMLPLAVDLELSRCPKCNTQIHPVAKEAIESKVEPKTYARYNEFWQCPNCGQVYWQGGHWGKIRATLKMAEENLGKMN